MAYAISLRFDPGVADVISACWVRLAEVGLSRSTLELGYPPHVTLAVYDELAVDAAIRACDRVLETAHQIAVTLLDITTFGTGSGVCYAAVAASPDLMRLQATTVAAIGEECRPHYRTGNWTPHCTLATDVADTDIGRAKASLERDWQPLTGVFEAAELVQFAPVVGIRRWTLSAPPPSIHTP